MSSSFKIPKKKQPEGSSHFHVQSPLSRLQSSAPQVKGYEDSCSRGGLRRRQGGGALSPAAGRDRPLFRDVVKTLLGLNSPNGGGVSAANHRSPASWNCQSQAKGWRPKRASDRLLQPDGEPQHLPPPPPTGVSLPLTNVSVDSLAELRAEGHAGSWSSSSMQTRGQSSEGTEEDQSDSCQSSGPKASEERVTSPTRTRIRIRLSAASPLSDVRQTRPDGRRSLDVPPRDVMEAQRERWKRFREGRSSASRPKKPRVAPAEPIVLSSEEEEEGEESGRRGPAEDGGGAEALRVSLQPPVTPPTFLQLQFSRLHVGLMQAHANGAATVTETAITLPVRGADDGQLVVVASQVWGYGVWDGGVARSGTLLAGWRGPAPSLLFLWVSTAQASMLHRELSAIQTSGGATGPSSSVLLLVLTEQLPELQAALLASILDLQSYRQGRSSHGGPASPLDWADGLTLVHSCPSPVDQHLLRLLGRSAGSSPPRSSQVNKSKPGPSDLQHLPFRLIQYPLSACKGRITVTREDLACLDAGEFFNDVIIDFYLKYLVVEGVASAVAERTHIFSSFFFRQLSRRRTAGEEDEDGAPTVPDRHRRHQRVKTWTRHLDIFTKDFLFVPVNQDSHWFLVVICFPGLEEPRQEQHQVESAGQVVSLPSAQPPECTLQGCSRRTVMKRPCILVMDSLKTSSHDGVCRLLRDYLQVEWEVRRTTPRLFSADSMKGFCCRVPQQDNSSDCGVFLLQFAHSFLQNPVVNFELPPRLENWFPRQQVRRKREEIRNLILELHQNQSSWE